MEKVENGMFVSVDYKGMLQDGDIFDTNSGGRPLEVQMGTGSSFMNFKSKGNALKHLRICLD